MARCLCYCAVVASVLEPPKWRAMLCRRGAPRQHSVPVAKGSLPRQSFWCVLHVCGMLTARRLLRLRLRILTSFPGPCNSAEERPNRFCRRARFATASRQSLPRGRCPRVRRKTRCFGRIPFGKASASALRPGFGQPEDRFLCFPD